VPGLAKFRAALREKGLDAAIISSPHNMTYVLGFHIVSQSYVVVPAEGQPWAPRVVTGRLEEATVRHRLGSAKVEVVVPQEGQKTFECIAGMLEAETAGAPIVGVEHNTLPHGTFLEIEKWLGVPAPLAADFVDCSVVVEQCRAVKAPEEIHIMREAAAVSVKAMKAALETARPGVPESEVAAQAEYTMRKLGAEGPAFETIVAAGPRSAFPHAQATDELIRAGDLLTIDLGAKWKGYCSDMTRTVLVGGDGPEEALRTLRTVNAAHRIGVDAVRPSTKWAETFKAVMNYFEQQGVAEYFTHSLGHGVGTEIHESPWLRRTGVDDTDVLLEGMVVTIEPGLYIEGVGGARTEDTVVVTARGCQALTEFPIEDYL
jgi:Xaa-Pro aminopeptidase